MSGHTGPCVISAPSKVITHSVLAALWLRARCSAVKETVSRFSWDLCFKIKGLSLSEEKRIHRQVDGGIEK